MEAPVGNPAVTEARTTERQQDGGPRAAVILGNDAIAAVGPCSLAGLVDACVAAGFDLVVPPSWGDELAAAEYLARLANADDRAVIACACPRVRAIVARASADAAPRVVSIAAPPVVAARYLRAVYSPTLLVTYVGDCPSGTDRAIDAQFSPSGFLASLHRQGIVIRDKPSELSDADAARWARHQSTAGGLPALRYLARTPVDRVLREVDETALQAHRLPASRSKMLLDLAATAGCSCSMSDGAGCDIPRQATPVVVAPAGMDFNTEPSSPNRRVAREAPPTVDTHPAAAVNAVGAHNASSESPAIAVSPPAVTPTSPLPSETRLRSLFPPPVVSAPREGAATAPRPADQPLVAGGARTREAPRSAALARDNSPRALALAGITVLVLGAAAALGTITYLRADKSPRLAKRTVATVAAGSIPESSAAPETQTPTATAIDTIPKPRTDSAATGTSASRPATPAGATAAARDTAAARRALRPRRARPAEIVPGWLPQGDQRWSPADTVTPSRPTPSTPRIRPDTTPRT